MSEQESEGVFPCHEEFTAKTKEALAKAVMLGGDSEKVTVNRAIQVYAELVEETVLHRKRIALHDDDKPVRIRLVFERGLPRLKLQVETFGIGK